MRRWALASAALAPVSLIGGWTLAAARQRGGFDATRDTISALAALDATDRWVMTAGIAVLGGCHVVTALGLPEARPLGRLLLGAGGVTAVLVAALPQPSAGHFPVATASFVALAVWPAFSDLPSRRAGVAASAGLTRRARLARPRGRRRRPARSRPSGWSPAPRRCGRSPSSRRCGCARARRAV